MPVSPSKLALSGLTLALAILAGCGKEEAPPANLPGV